MAKPPVSNTFEMKTELGKQFNEDFNLNVAWLDLINQNVRAFTLAYWGDNLMGMYKAIKMIMLTSDYKMHWGEKKKTLNKIDKDNNIIKVELSYWTWVNTLIEEIQNVSTITNAGNTNVDDYKMNLLKLKFESIYSSVMNEMGVRGLLTKNNDSIYMAMGEMDD